MHIDSNAVNNTWPIKCSFLSRLSLNLHLFPFSDTETQLRTFQVFYVDSNGTEEFLYDDSGSEYDTGIYNITVSPAVSATAVIIRRPDVLTLCEVEVFQGSFSFFLVFF